MNNYIRVFLVVVLAAVVGLLFFIAGTVVGFNTAINQLSECKMQSCTSLGVNASSCEVCPESGLRIIGIGKRVG